LRGRHVLFQFKELAVSRYLCIQLYLDVEQVPVFLKLFL